MELRDREFILKEIINNKKAALESTVPGSLRISRDKGKIRYYHRKNSDDKYGVFISNDNIQLARLLAQKSYDKKVLKAAERELEAVERYRARMPKYKAEEIYGHLHPERQKMVVPDEEPVEEFVARWEAEEYQRKGFRDDMPMLVTSRGERVRSKSEIIISDLLYSAGVPYRYECPLHLGGYGIVHPDFTVLNTVTRQEVYWEHLGMMDNAAYMEKAIQKLDAYESNGYYIGEKLIITYETNKLPINQLKIKRLIQRCFG